MQSIGNVISAYSVQVKRQLKFYFIPLIPSTYYAFTSTCWTENHSGNLWNANSTKMIRFCFPILTNKYFKVLQQINRVLHLEFHEDIQYAALEIFLKIRITNHSWKSTVPCRFYYYIRKWFSRAELCSNMNHEMYSMKWNAVELY